MSKTIKILHISSLYGGGVGTVVSGYLKNVKDNNSFTHTLVSLDTINTSFMELMQDYNITIFGSMRDNYIKINELIDKSDIVIIHHWNHPLISEFLVKNLFPKCRLIIWSHVSGLFAPYVYSQKLIEFSDSFIFTTPLSFDAKEIIGLPSDLKEKLSVIWSLSDNIEFYNITPKIHDGFNIGLTGTVDYGKLHTDFLEMSNNVAIDNCRFIVCSGDSQESIAKEAAVKNIDTKFQFKGRVPDLKEYLSIFDVFGYPLHRAHFGSCEQSLTEAMIAGVVPVVLDNPTESHIVKDGVTGIVAKSKVEYSKAIEYLYKNPDVKNQMAINAKEDIHSRFTMKEKIEKWENAFSSVLRKDKNFRYWGKGIVDLSGYSVFIQSLGDYGSIFTQYCNFKQCKNYDGLNSTILDITRLFKSNPMFYSKSKGSINQYLQFFPNDTYLLEWSKLL